MNKMIGIVMIILGIILIAAGILVFRKYQNLEAAEQTSALVSSEAMTGLIQAVTADGVLTNKEKSVVEQAAAKYHLDAQEALSRIDEILTSDENEAETEIVDQQKKKGDDFEKFIIKKFNKQFFSIKQWAGDKYVEGFYSEKTMQPDIIVEFKLRDYTKKVAIECKWRSSTQKGGIQFSYDNQLKRYKTFEQKEQMEVYVAIGVGGKASKPDYLYFIPLSKTTEPFISENELKQYQKSTNGYFFLDPKNGSLNINSSKPD